MKIRVKLISVEGPAPPGFDENGEGTVVAAEGAMLADIVDALGLSPLEPYVTLVNDQPVPADERAGRAVAPGDTLTIFPPIKGG